MTSRLSLNKEGNDKDPILAMKRTVSDSDNLLGVAVTESVSLYYPAGRLLEWVVVNSRFYGEFF